MARHDLFEAEAKILRFVAFDVQLPVFAARLAHVDNHLSLAGSLKTKIEIVAHGASVDAHDAIARFKLQLRAQAAGRNFCDLDAAAANLGYCWRDGKLVH